MRACSAASLCPPSTTTSALSSVAGLAGGGAAVETRAPRVPRRPARPTGLRGRRLTRRTPAALLGRGLGQTRRFFAADHDRAVGPALSIAWVSVANRRGGTSATCRACGIRAASSALAMAVPAARRVSAMAQCSGRFEHGLRLLSWMSGNGLVVQVLRMPGLGEEEPALGQQPDVLHAKRRLQRRRAGAGRAMAEQDQRHDER